jgi:hypothetical protein
MIPIIIEFSDCYSDFPFDTYKCLFKMTGEDYRSMLVSMHNNPEIETNSGWYQKAYFNKSHLKEDSKD